MGHERARSTVRDGCCQAPSSLVPHSLYVFGGGEPFWLPQKVLDIWGDDHTEAESRAELGVLNGDGIIRQ
jgi:hypothetical protein